MAKQRTKTGGNLFKNERKTEDWHSDMGGSFEVLETLEPGKYFLNGYKKVASNGNEYISISIGKKMEKVERDVELPESKPVTAVEDDFDDDLLF